MENVTFRDYDSGISGFGIQGFGGSLVITPSKGASSCNCSKCSKPKVITLNPTLNPQTLNPKS